MLWRQSINYLANSMFINALECCLIVWQCRSRMDDEAVFCMEDSYTDQCGSPIRDLGGSKPHTAIFRCIISLYTHPHHPFLKTMQKKKSKNRTSGAQQALHMDQIVSQHISQFWNCIETYHTPVLLFLFSFLYPNLCPKWSKLFLSGLILSLQCFY